MPGRELEYAAKPALTDQVRRLAGAERPVILVEGTRKLPDAMRPALVAMGRRLAEALPRAVFRTGGASGSDEAFAEGVRSVDPCRVEYVLPQAGHRAKSRDARSPAFVLEQLADTGLRAVAEQTVAASPRYEGLARRYVQNKRSGVLAVKTRYLLRDTLKVTGDPERNLPGADLGIFYVDEANPLSGGTGHTIRVCLRHGVPVYTQDQWATEGFPSSSVGPASAVAGLPIHSSMGCRSAPG